MATNVGTETKWRSIYVELMGSQTRFVKGERYTTRVIEAGSGEPLILIHGGGGHAEGESMGAHITFRLGLEHPDRCGKLILNTGAQINFKRTFPPPLNPVENAMRLGLEALDSLSPDAIRSRLEWLMTTPDRVTDELVEVRLQLYSQPDVREAMRASFTAALSTPPGGRRARYEEEDCAKLKPPTLVFWTEFNPSNPPEVGEHLASLIPGSKHYLMKDAAHWPQWEHPEEHDRVISDFIQGRL